MDIKLNKTKLINLKNKVTLSQLHINIMDYMTMREVRTLGHVI